MGGRGRRRSGSGDNVVSRSGGPAEPQVEEVLAEQRDKEGREVYLMRWEVCLCSGGGSSCVGRA